MTTRESRSWLTVVTTLLVFILGTADSRAQDSASLGTKSKAASTSATPAPESRDQLKGDKEVRARETDDYKIGEQDVLTVTIWKEPELSGTVVVRPDGKITVPLVDEISVVGLTPAELQRTLTAKFRPFLTVAQVTVIVREIHSRKIYLIGQVAREGSYPINSSTTVLQLIAEAGGFRDFAKRKKIYIMRHEKGKDVRYPFNYDRVLQGKTPDQNILLRPGDTIVVP